MTGVACLKGTAAGVLVAILGLGAGSSRAEAAPPDWTGLYEIVRDMPGHKPIAPGDELDKLVTSRLQPWARAKMEVTDTEAEDTGAVCQLAGIFRHPTTVSGFQWVQKPDEAYIISDSIEEVGVRRVYMTDHHPAHIFPSWDGHSIGRWEGDTLVIDTTGFNDRSWLMSGMEPHSEALHVVERVRAVDDGKALEVVTTVDDRLALTGPYTYSRYYRKLDRPFSEAAAHAGTGVCNGDPGEPQRWNGRRLRAIARQAASRQAADQAGAKP